MNFLIAKYMPFRSYGPRGTRAISIALDKHTQSRAILPPPDHISPLSRDDWFEHVMVPEVGRLLIEQDMYGGKPTAWHVDQPVSKEVEDRREISWKVLVESRIYGSSRFGENGDFDKSDLKWAEENRRAMMKKKPTRSIEHVDLT